MKNLYNKIQLKEGVKAVTLYQLMVEAENEDKKCTTLLPLDKQVAGFISLPEAERAQAYLSKKLKMNISVIPTTHNLFINFNAYKSWKEVNTKDFTPTVPAQRDLKGLNKIYMAVDPTSQRFGFKGEYIDKEEAQIAVGDCGQVVTKLVFDDATKFYRYFAYKPETEVSKQTEIKL